MAKVEEPILLDDDDEPEASGQGQAKKSGGTEIPNFRGKVIEAEGTESKGPLQVQWTEDGDDDEDEDEDEDDEEEEEGDVAGVKAAAEAKKDRKRANVEEETEHEVVEEEELWDFPKDEEGWTEADLGEEWADPSPADDTVGRDPELAEEDEELIAKLEKEGRAPVRRPYYVPYRKFYPLIPEDHPDIETPQDVVEELERMEEFLVWVSYVFKDGSSYEGTVWDDLAHGKGVYTTALELCKYEGEWFQNMMQGHGVLQVDVPTMNPPPDSELEKKMREEGHILAADFMPPEDREWLKMDIEDTFEIYPEVLKTPPLEEDENWVKLYGQKPEKGHYKYAGQWKHNRMHGCGVYTLNSRQIWGKFYFGDLLPDIEECTAEMSAIHASLAEVAAAKARMFVNKPDGMVREVKGPYNDPQHPYMYEEEDLWMAPGFINEYYKIPELWKTYVEDVDQERQMWLNSFIKSPLRIPMPAELEHQWSKNDEFVVLTNEPSSALGYDPENLERAKESLQGEVLLHVPTGQIINWATDPDGNMRFFLQPIRDDNQVVPEDAIPLPLGFDEEGEGEGEEEGEGAPERQLTEKEKKQKQWEEEDRKRREKWKKQAELRARKYLREDAEFLLKVYEDMEADRLKALAQDEKLQLMLLDDEEPSGTQVEDGSPVDQAESVEEPSEVKGESSDDKKPPTAEVKDVEADEEEAEDDDDDKKPRSFGKVAMIDPDMMKAKPTNCHGSQDAAAPKLPPFPTVFASLSLLSQVAFRPVFHSILGPTLAGVKTRVHSILKPGLQHQRVFVPDQVKPEDSNETPTSSPTATPAPAPQQRIWAESVGYRSLRASQCYQAAVKWRASPGSQHLGPGRRSQRQQLHKHIPAPVWALSALRCSLRQRTKAPRIRTSRTSPDGVAGKARSRRIAISRPAPAPCGASGADPTVLCIGVPVVQ